MSAKTISLLLVCLFCAVVLFMQFGPKGDKQSIGLIKLQAQRAIDWFDEKKLLNDLSSYDTNMMNRQIFIDKGAGISKFLDYSDNGNFKNVLGFFGGKKGLYVKDESSFNEEDMDALKKYISSGGHIYFETFSFYSLTVGEENEEKINYFKEQIKAGKIAIVCFQPFDSEGKSNKEILNNMYPLITEKNVDLFSKVLQETIDAQKEFNAND